MSYFEKMQILATDTLTIDAFESTGEKQGDFLFKWRKKLSL